MTIGTGDPSLPVMAPHHFLFFFSIDTSFLQRDGVGERMLFRDILEVQLGNLYSLILALLFFCPGKFLLGLLKICAYAHHVYSQIHQCTESAIKQVYSMLLS